MKIAIIGAGITGLTAAFNLSGQGHTVTIYEQSSQPGGLGSYIRIGDNYLERFYHHFFQSDIHVVKLINELNLKNKLHFYKAKTGIYIDQTIYPFSNAFDLLNFSGLDIFDRIRLGIMFAYLKYYPLNERELDSISAADFIINFGGRQVYEKIWKPLLVGKFEKFADKIPALWLRERIRDRSPQLGYLDGGVKVLIDELIRRIESRGSFILLNTPVQSIENTPQAIKVVTNNKISHFDRVIVTTVSPIASKLIKNGIQNSKRKQLDQQDQLGAICLILELKDTIQSQYWVNICDLKENVLVLVEHTNLIGRASYGGRHLVYLANYIHRDHERFKATDTEIMNDYTEILHKINRKFNSSWIIRSHISRVPRAQTIFNLNSLSTRPPIELIKNRIYLANIDQMYPHDRNFNLGVELGKKVSSMLL